MNFDDESNNENEEHDTGIDTSHKLEVLEDVISVC